MICRERFAAERQTEVCRTIWRKGQESNLQAMSAVVFGTTALPVRLPFRGKTIFGLWILNFVNLELECVFEHSTNEIERTDLRSQIENSNHLCQKIDEGRENIAANTLR